MDIKEINLADIKPYAKNQKKHPETQVKNIATSIQKYGFVQPVVLDTNNEVIIGHGRLLAAKQLKMKQIPCVYAENLTDEQIRELRIIDNKLNESEWDIDFLKLDLDELDFSDFDIDFGLSDEEEVAEDDDENIYTSEINIPQYDIVGDKPKISELVDTQKSKELIEEIENSGLNDEIKNFLIKAAERHNVFDYRKIAEYYAQATEEVQRLMEKSALVIIDYDDAIKNGYVNFKKGLGEILNDK